MLHQYMCNRKEASQHAVGCAGWRFLLKRCSPATALHLALTPAAAQTILRALRSAGAFNRLHHVADLRITMKHPDAATSCASTPVAFCATALACKDLQVLHSDLSLASDIPSTSNLMALSSQHEPRSSHEPA